MSRSVTVRQFIEDSLIKQIEEIGKGTPFTYHAFALDSIAIEFLGKILAQRPSFDTKDTSGDDFKKAIEMLFPDEYHKHSSFLYDQLRCGMLHFFGPKSKIALGEEKNEGRNSHLTPDENGKLILVFEVFHDDFKKAAEKLFKLNYKNLDQIFLVIDQKS